METTSEARVYEYVRKFGPVSIPVIKEKLGMWERNEVEKAVLMNMRFRRLEMTSKGVQVRLPEGDQVER